MSKKTYNGDIQEAWLNNGEYNKRVIPAKELPKIDILRAFLKDIDITEIIVKSKRIGFSYMYTKLEQISNYNEHDRHNGILNKLFARKQRVRV